MASLNGFVGYVTGTSGSVGLIEPKGSWKVYIFPRGAHADAASSGTTVNFDSADAASRFTANDWVQVGTDNGKIRQVTGVGGDSITVNTAVSVSQNDRVFRIGTTQPTTTNSITTYQPHTTIYLRDDDGATPVSNSQLTSDSNGLFQFWAADSLYDGMVQDANGTNQFSLIDIAVGAQVATSFTPIIGRSEDLGSCAKPWDNFTYSGEIISAVTSATGATSHRFATCGGVTQGNLFSFENNNVTQVYGDTRGGIFHSWTLPRVYNVKSARFGAKGDNSTDDTAAIQAAIDAADAENQGNAGGAGLVFLPNGVYVISSALTLPSGLVLKGEERRSTVLRAHSTFAAGYMVHIGSGSGNVHGTRIESITLDCDEVDGVGGLWLRNAQEGAGARDFLIIDFKNASGITTTSGQATQNWTIQDGEVGGKAAANPAININGAGGNILLSDLTLGTNDSNSVNAAALQILSANYAIERLHLEKHTTGISLGLDATGFIKTVSGHNTIDDLVRISNHGNLVFNNNVSGGTKTINDLVTGVSFSNNSGGWYLLSNDSAVGGTRTRFSSSANAWSHLNSPTAFGNTLTANAAFGVTGSFFGSSMVIVTTGTAVTLPAGNFFGLSSSPGGSTTTTSIATAGNNGRVVKFIGIAGTNTISDGTGLKTDAGSIAVGVGHLVEFICMGSTWYQSQPKVSTGGL